MTWKPGQSGNPGGRPSDIPSLVRLARARSPEAFKRICELMKSDNETVALAAADKVLDRAWGKPAQESTVNVRHDDITEWSRAEIVARLTELRARRETTRSLPVPNGRGDEPDQFH